jgi:hypothetical protein
MLTYTKPFPGNVSGQYLPIMAGDSLGHTSSGLGLTKEDNTTTSAGAADLGRQSSVATRHLD